MSRDLWPGKEKKGKQTDEEEKKKILSTKEREVSKGGKQREAHGHPQFLSKKQDEDFFTLILSDKQRNCLI